MKWLEKWFETHQPKGKWSWLGSTYEAFHTFTFVRKTVTRNGAEMTVEVRLDRQSNIVSEMLDVPGVYDATLIAHQGDMIS